MHRQRGLLYTAPTMGSTAAERFLALSIAGARKTLYVTNRSWLERIAERASSLIGRLL